MSTYPIPHGVDLQKIIGVLRRSGFEGPQQLRGYIPCNLVGGGTANYTGGPNPERYRPMGISGVTVGTGVDLGQTDVATLRDIGVSEPLIRRLRPYIGERREDAVEALHAAPLTLAQDEADALDMSMISHHVAKISARYDRDAGTDAFAALPWQAQAVIVSLLYQRGVGSPKKYPNTWAALVRADWRDAADRLRNARLWQGYHHRRASEGRLLETVIPEAS